MAFDFKKIIISGNKKQLFSAGSYYAARHNSFLKIVRAGLHIMMKKSFEEVQITGNKR